MYMCTLLTKSHPASFLEETARTQSNVCHQSMKDRKHLVVMVGPSMTERSTLTLVWHTSSLFLGGSSSPLASNDQSLLNPENPRAVTEPVLVAVGYSLSPFSLCIVGFLKISIINVLFLH